jgi:hypothetical protein
MTGSEVRPQLRGLHCHNALVSCSGESHRPVASTVDGRNADELGGEAGTALCPQVVLNPCPRCVGVSLGSDMVSSNTYELSSFVRAGCNSSWS